MVRAVEWSLSARRDLAAIIRFIAEIDLRCTALPAGEWPRD